MSHSARAIEAAHRGMGGADCAVLLGNSRHEDRVALWRAKRGLEVTATTTVAGDDAARLDAIANAYATEVGGKVRRLKADHALRHCAHPFMVAHVDGVLVMPGGPKRIRWNAEKLNVPDILQVELVTDADIVDRWAATSGPRGPSPRAVHEVMHRLAATGARRCHLVVASSLGGSNRVYHHVVERDDSLVGQLIATEAEFWRTVEQGVEPAAPVEGARKSPARLQSLRMFDDPGAALREGPGEHGLASWRDPFGV
jgi:predicted phage-related endonuclease